MKRLIWIWVSLSALTVATGTRAADDLTEVHAKAVAGKAILALQHGLATGELQPFYDLLDESISFFFPNMSEYRYLKGKPPVQAFFDRVHSGYNRVAISLDVCGEKICAYREYFGSDAKSN
jgi:hypothetical protein